MEIDLNLDNYDLHDLLNIFNLNYNFTIEYLKQSKKIVMQIHQVYKKASICGLFC